MNLPSLLVALTFMTIGFLGLVIIEDIHREEEANR